MNGTPPSLDAGCAVGRRKLAAVGTIALASSFGLCAGYLDVVFIVVKKLIATPPSSFKNAADFPWTVPAAHAALLLFPGTLLGVVTALRGRGLPLRAASWLLATLAIWGALLRLPLYGWASLILAAGLGVHLSAGVVALRARPKLAWAISGWIYGIMLLLAAGSSGWRAARESMARGRLPQPPTNSRNVILVVWDAVRAKSLSLYGYPHNTTPRLTQWARKGRRYDLALAPAPWTYPSHTSFFTGYWPFQLVSQWKYSLDAPVPTLAEHLASLGYETVGYSANTVMCNYETRLDRGFLRFVDYPLTPQSLISRTVPGSWLLEHVLYHGDYYQRKWVRVQSRNANEINREFLSWLEHRQSSRPFFAYLNYFDAHDPYLAPPGYEGRFGMRPQSRRDYQFLLDYASPGLKLIQNRDIRLARDCYDDCISYLDDQLGELLDNLAGSGILKNTLVVVTSDHGESFGEHGFFVHGTNLYLDELAVPLVILAPGGPDDRVVREPVSLRDLPATILDLVGLSAGSGFPGQSLATSGPGSALLNVSPALAEHTTPPAFTQKHASGLERRDVQMSLVSAGHHYIRDGLGAEQLYDLTLDRSETVNLLKDGRAQERAAVVRKSLLDALDASPAATESENAYLAAYREWLGSL
jgi:arylsulfatase A-like enzyme